MNNSRKIFILLAVGAIIMALIYGQSIIIPFVLAILFWFIIRIIKIGLMKIKFVSKIPTGIVTIFSSLVFLSFLVLIVTMVTKNIQQLSEAMPEYEKNVNTFTEYINESFDINLEEAIGDYSSDIEFGGILTDLFSASESF